MNAVQNAIKDIKFGIPMEVLVIAFSEQDRTLNNMINLDDRLLSAVIRPRVLVDCNIVGGIETKINLEQCKITSLSNREYVVEIPKDLTNNRSIITVLSLVSNVIYGRVGSYGDTPDLLSAGLNVMNNLGTETVVQTSRLEMLSDSVLLISDPSIYIINGILRCIIENSPNMENIHPRSYNSFSKLVTLAVKSYIYNTLVVKLDKGYVYGGHELGIVKDIIDNYSTSEEDYQEYLTTVWKEVAFINDTEKMNRFVRMNIANTI